MIDRRVIWAALLLVFTACSDFSGLGIGSAERDLRFLTSATDAPELAQTSVGFWAYRDRATEARIWYRARPGRSDSTELVTFEVPDRSIAADSVRITMTVVDPDRLIVQFEPAGLRFSPERPARLQLAYSEAGVLSAVGAVVGIDLSLRALLGVWRQEQPGDPWFKIPSVRLDAASALEADILGFTRYAIAY